MSSKQVSNQVYSSKRRRSGSSRNSNNNNNNNNKNNNKNKNKKNISAEKQRVADRKEIERKEIVLKMEKKSSKSQMGKLFEMIDKLSINTKKGGFYKLKKKSKIHKNKSKKTKKH
jgi:hypothetical protein